MNLDIIDFALRHFDPSADKASADKGTDSPSSLLKIRPAEFVDWVREKSKDTELLDGYAPFCKHLILPNPFNVYPCCIELTDDLKPHIQTAYLARTPKELPVLTRYIPVDALKLKPAKFIDVILYSREQVLKESEAMGDDISKLPPADWYIISLKFQDVDKECPMLPITMLRNSLIEEGGSGVPVDRSKYAESVEFWTRHISVQ